MSAATSSWCVACKRSESKQIREDRGSYRLGLLAIQSANQTISSTARAAPS